jgi:hypothetical protein
LAFWTPITSLREQHWVSVTADDKDEGQAFEVAESIGPLRESRLEGEKRAGSYLKTWHPENASVEVWSQVASDTPTIVELTLRENLIHYRLESTENGMCKLAVLPEDAPRA